METAERADGTLAREIAAPGEKAADAREKTDIICALGNGESRGEEFRQGSQANELACGVDGEKTQPAPPHHTLARHEWR